MSLKKHTFIRDNTILVPAVLKTATHIYPTLKGDKKILMPQGSQP